MKNINVCLISWRVYRCLDFPGGPVGKESTCMKSINVCLISWWVYRCFGFPGGSAGKESTCNAGDWGSIPGLGRSPEEGKGYPVQYSGLENSMDCIVHGITESQTRLSNFHFHFHTGVYHAVLSTCLHVLKFS